MSNYKKMKKNKQRRKIAAKLHLYQFTFLLYFLVRLWKDKQNLLEARSERVSERQQKVKIIIIRKIKIVRSMKMNEID